MSSNPAPIALVDEAATDAKAPLIGDDARLSSQVNEGADDPDSARPEPVVVVLDGSALELARAAAAAEAGNADDIGEFLVAIAEDDVAVTATFAALQAGYRGWQWSITLAVLSAGDPTVSEVVLLPGEGALLAPAWIPWDERIRAGDLGVGDLLPPTADDPRLAPAYLQSDDPAVEAVATELGVGRVRVLSREGRVDFAERLHDGRFGPSDGMAVGAPGQCFSCAFYLPLAGSLGQLVGACGNEFSPAEGRVVDAGYGCGAHSETVIEMPARSAATDTVIDELSLEVHHRPVEAGWAEASSVQPEPADTELVTDLPDTELVADLPADTELVADLPADDGSADAEFVDPGFVEQDLPDPESADAELADAALLDSDPAVAAAAAAEVLVSEALTTPDIEG